jgi:hypothetical protein
VCFICGTLPTGTLIVYIPNLFPPKEKHNVGLLRFDDDHDNICYRFAQVRIFGEKVMYSDHYTVVDLIVIYIISGIKAILQDSSVKIADDESVSLSSSVTHEFSVICFSPRVMYNILSTAANY